MALQLPPRPRDRDVPLPPAPAHPPTLANIYEARRYTTLVLQSKRSDRRGCATVDDVGRAILYESAAAQSAAAAAIGPAVVPPWFAPVQQQLNHIQQQLNRIDIKASRALNAVNEDGTTFPFEIVLFVDGADPTAPPHNLPALTSTAIIDALEGVHAANYLIGYGIAVPHLIAERRRVLKAYLGCVIAQHM